MKIIRYLSLTLLATTALSMPSTLSAQIINIDFIGTRTDDPMGSPEPTPHGASGDPSPFSSGGTVYNDLVANDTADSDNITVAATSLLDSNGATTSIGFSIGPVGADNNGLGVFNGSDLFINSANNSLTSVPFTITGLGSATSVDIAFLTVGDGNSPIATFDGVTATTIKDNGYQYEFDDIPVTGGVLTGTIGGSNTGPAFLISGLGIEVVPEPSTWLLIMAGSLGLVHLARRRSSASI